MTKLTTEIKRMLNALTFQSESALLSLHADALADGGIDLQKEALSGGPVSELAHYLRRHSEVVFLVRNETGYPGRGLLNGSQRWGVLPVPVVLVLNR